MKTVLLNSGGKDSLATAILLSRDGHDLHSFTVDVGQPEHAKGNGIAKKIADKYCASHHVFRATTGPYLAETFNLPVGWRYVTIPYKALVVWSLGAMYASSIGAAAVASGMRADIFPEEFPETLKAMFELSRKVRDPVEVIVPLNGYKGRQGELNEYIWGIVKDDPLWKETSHCEAYPPCGACYGCRLRAEWLSRG